MASSNDSNTHQKRERKNSCVVTQFNCILNKMIIWNFILSQKLEGGEHLLLDTQFYISMYLVVIYDTNIKTCMQ